MENFKNSQKIGLIFLDINITQCYKKSGIFLFLKFNIGGEDEKENISFNDRIFTYWS